MSARVRRLGLMVPDAIQVDAKKALTVNDRPRNLVSHPLPHPSLGADQHADG